MSRSPFAHRRAANQADFAGPDADREAIERLTRAARLANEQQGGGRVPDEVLQRNTLLIEAAQAERGLRDAFRRVGNIAKAALYERQLAEIETRAPEARAIDAPAEGRTP